MEHIYNPSQSFKFEEITLSHPVSVNGGSYFTKLTMENRPLFIQMTQCKTKQGIVKTGKKVYLDLMFSAADGDVIEWVENLEKTVQKIIYEKREAWFNNDLELEDIEGAFTSPIRIFKSGKFYLVRVYVQNNIPGSNGFTCYDENEKIVEPEDINDKTCIIPLLEVRGVKFSSRSFQIDIILRQIMVVEENKFLKGCFIKQANSKEDLGNVQPDTQAVVDTEPEEHQEEVNKESEVQPVVEAESEKVETESDIQPVVETEEVKPEEDAAEPIDTQPVVEVEDKTEEEELDKKEEDTETLGELQEFNLEVDTLEDAELKLKSPEDVHLELWREAREKAKQARALAIAAYLEARNIKEIYRIENLEDSGDELDEILESGNF